ncbi:MAG: DUF1345 domain-containing protein [Acidimicrobiales bacterium]
MTRALAVRRHAEGDQQRELPAGTRIFLGSLLGALGGVAVSFVVLWQAATLIGWDLAALFYLCTTWWALGRLDADGSHRVAVRQDPSVASSELVLIVAAIACLGGVGLALVRAGQIGGDTKAFLIVLGVASVVASWATVHTIFTLRYARLYYSGQPGGIDFNEHAPPSYLDFAYVAFTIGMTFQVSDTDLTTHEIRRTALRHALLSYLFGVVIIGMMINIVASLLK